VALEPVLKEATELGLSGSAVKCIFNFSPGLWYAKADAGQISQVFYNLVINAREAMVEGGVLAIAAVNFPTGTDSEMPLPEGKYIKISVSDTGPGIPPEVQQQIFDPFYTTKPHGTGLGLTSSYSVIKNHGGLLTVFSLPGGGTTFNVFLKASAEQKIIDEQFAGEPGRGSGRILVMDDNELVRETTGEILKEYGYQPDFAADGLSALEKFIQAKNTGNPFRAVILDLTIPGGMGGKETLQRMLRFDPKIVAIAATGYSEDPVVQNPGAYGFRAVVKKAGLHNELLINLERHLNSETDHLEGGNVA
jgi:CheY-like chemotaxis protein